LTEKPAFLIYSCFLRTCVILTLQNNPFRLKDVRTKPNTEAELIQLTKIKLNLTKPIKYSATLNQNLYNPAQSQRIEAHQNKTFPTRLNRIMCNSTKLKSMKPVSTKSYPTRLKYYQSNTTQ